MAHDRAQAAATERELYEWSTPEDFLAVVENLKLILDTDAMFRAGRAFREGYIAGRLARRRGAEVVRLLRERPGISTPDFELRLPDGTMLRYETTEADVPGRRRADEYREPPQVEPMVLTNMEVMVGVMQRLAAKKAAKTYDACQGLVIFVNPPYMAFDHRIRWSQLLEASRPAAAAFPEVWVMRGTGSLTWLDGQPQEAVSGEEF